MAVLDASLVVDGLIGAPPIGDAARQVLGRHAVLQVPSVFPAEVVSALRALHARGQISFARASAALEQVRTLRTIQYPFEPFARRAWDLRDNLTIYDAWDVALAEWLEDELITADCRLAEAPGPTCAVRLIGADSP
jgi:predicted nucleic acid-binding protein